MKKIINYVKHKKIFAHSLLTIASLFGIMAANTRCFWIYHQEDVPPEIRKYKKI